LAAISEQYLAYEKAYQSLKHTTCYAVKANSSAAVLSALHQEGCGFDVNSHGELYRVMKVGASPERITMTGVGKTARDIVDGLDAGILLFNAESFEECELINAIAGEKNVVANIVLRVNPDVGAETHPYIATGLAEHKFGLHEDAVRNLLPAFATLKSVSLIGFGMHLGSQIFEPSPFVDGLKKLFPLTEQAVNQHRYSIRFLNIGGGIGVPYSPADPRVDATQIAQSVIPIVREFSSKSGIALTLLSEPGRYFVANAGILLTRVKYVKRAEQRTFVILDAGMNDLIRPALYNAHHEIHPIDFTEDRGEEVIDIVGPVCESGDTFAVQRRMRRVEAGEYVAIFSAGAYGSTMSSNYNSRPLAQEIGVRGRHWFIARRRQTMEEMLQAEALPPYGDSEL